MYKANTKPLKTVKVGLLHGQVKIKKLKKRNCTVHCIQQNVRKFWHKEIVSAIDSFCNPTFPTIKKLLVPYFVWVLGLKTGAQILPDGKQNDANLYSCDWLYLIQNV